MWGINTALTYARSFLTRQQILDTYGEPGPDYNAKYCQLVNISATFPWFPYKGNVLINNDFWIAVHDSFIDLQTEGVQGEIKTYDGCYNFRNTRGTGLISLHSWALAMDMNALIEYLGRADTSWSDKFVEIMTRRLFWGGQFKGRKDPMHFSLYGE